MLWLIKKLPVWLESKVDPIELLVRLIVGGIFIFAGYNKLIDLQAFELAVRNYSFSLIEMIANEYWIKAVYFLKHHSMRPCPYNRYGISI